MRCRKYAFEFTSTINYVMQIKLFYNSNNPFSNNLFTVIQFTVTLRLLKKKKTSHYLVHANFVEGRRMLTEIAEGYIIYHLHRFLAHSAVL